MLEDFTANIEQEGAIGEKAFERPEIQEKETPAATPAEQKPAEKPSQGGDNTPDVNNRKQREESRWQKAQAELAELRKYKSDTQPRLETYQQTLDRLGTQKESVPQIPEWFPKSGNKQADEQKYKEYLSYESGVKAQIKQELLEDQTKEALEKAAEEEKWSSWVNDSLDKLEDDGLKFDRNELQAVALKFLPSDEDGNIDFRRAYEIMTELKKTTPPVQNTQARKDIGALSTTTKQSSEQKKPQYETQRTLRNKSFDQLIRETN